MHGVQFTDPGLWRTPLAYYARSGPVGQTLSLAGRRPDVAVVGLGTGALACYRKPGENWTFFEIDGAVEKLARDVRYFHYLSACGGDTHVVLGDGRLSLNAVPDRQYDLVIVDAFSSDSIPMHLFTKQAVELYLRKLKPGGIILFHISNLYLDLAPVLTTIVQSAGAAAMHQLYAPSPPEKAAGASESEWMVIAANKDDLAFLAGEPRWRAPATAGGQPWTDDFSNIFQAIKW
jgi:spermidine synthase